MAREIYRADGVSYSELAERQLAACEAHGGAKLPICMAKTQYSFSADPEAKGAPTGFVLPVKDVRVSAQLLHPGPHAMKSCRTCVKAHLHGSDAVQLPAQTQKPRRRPQALCCP